MDLRIDPDELNTCVQCGLCLPHCPTYRVTGDETLSPRGRIKLMRDVQNDGAPLTTEVVEAFATCVQCRGCEPACPSGVPYGHMMEATRETLAEQRAATPRWLRAGFGPLDSPRLLRIGSSALAVAQRLRLVPSSLGLPEDLPVRRKQLRPSEQPGERGTVWLFTGCVMDAWQRDVHLATQRNLEAAGFSVVPTAGLAPCCGALQAHSGLGHDARRLGHDMVEALGRERTIGGFELDASTPVIVNSAGCGAAMKSYDHTLETADAAAFVGRVFDSQEFLAEHLDHLPSVDPLDLRVAVQDPCHLRHVQRAHEATRPVLRPFVRELVELDDEGLCCGAGGAYSVLEPELAGAIRDRKVGAIDRAAPDVVASANPGCSMHLGQAGVETLHPMELVDLALQAAR